MQAPCVPSPWRWKKRCRVRASSGGLFSKDPFAWACCAPTGNGGKGCNRRVAVVEAAHLCPGSLLISSLFPLTCKVFIFPSVSFSNLSPNILGILIPPLLVLWEEVGWRGWRQKGLTQAAFTAKELLAAGASWSLAGEHSFPTTPSQVHDACCAPCLALLLPVWTHALPSRLDQYNNIINAERKQTQIFCCNYSKYPLGITRAKQRITNNF